MMRTWRSALQYDSHWSGAPQRRIVPPRESIRVTGLTKKSGGWHVGTARSGRDQGWHRLADAQPAGVAERAVVRDDRPSDQAHRRVREGCDGALRGDPRRRHAFHGGRRHQGLPQVADREQGGPSRRLRDARGEGAPDDLPDPPHAEAGAGLGAGRRRGLRPVADPELRPRDRVGRRLLHPGLPPYRPVGRRRRDLFPAAHRGRAQSPGNRPSRRKIQRRRKPRPTTSSTGSCRRPSSRPRPRRWRASSPTARPSLWASPRS